MSDVTVSARDRLPSFEVTPDTVQLFCYSAITWNPHRIHYDAGYAHDVEGYDDVLVHGPLMGSWLMRLCASWVSGWGEVESITYRTTVSVLPGTRLLVTGAVTNHGERPEAEIWIELPDGTKATHGSVRAVRRPVAADDRHSGVVIR